MILKCIVRDPCYVNVSEGSINESGASPDLLSKKKKKSGIDGPTKNNLLSFISQSLKELPTGTAKVIGSNSVEVWKVGLFWLLLCNCLNCHLTTTIVHYDCYHRGTNPISTTIVRCRDELATFFMDLVCLHWRSKS